MNNRPISVAAASPVIWYRFCQAENIQCLKLHAADAEAAGDRDALTSDVGRLVGREEDGGMADFGRRAPALDRQRLVDLVDPGLGKDTPVPLHLEHASLD